MTTAVFGHLTDGRPVDRIRIGAEPGPVVDVITLGAAVHRLEVGDRAGIRRSVALGRDTVPDLLTIDGFLGATIGRFANRIAGGRFEVDGRPVATLTNDRGHTLHGGPDGWDKRLWTVAAADRSAVTLTLTSPDGDMGFPGTVEAAVTYAVDGDVVRILLSAVTDAPTVVSMTNHTYFNLDGDGAGTIDGHTLAVHADRFTPVDETGIPLGRHLPVAGGPFDLRAATGLGQVLRVDDAQLAVAGGIDHNYLVRGTGLRPVATLRSPRTGIGLEVHSDQPGLQVYTGNMLEGRGRGGRRYRVGDGIALEPQLYPDTPRHEGEAGWPSSTLGPGETYLSTIEWRFHVEPAEAPD